MTRRYDCWGGNPKGTLEDPTHCVASVPDSTGWHFYQCRRKRGYGPNGEYCKQHAKKFLVSTKVPKGELDAEHSDV